MIGSVLGSAVFITARMYIPRKVYVLASFLYFIAAHFCFFCTCSSLCFELRSNLLFQHVLSYFLSALRLGLLLLLLTGFRMAMQV